MLASLLKVVLIIAFLKFNVPKMILFIMKLRLKSKNTFFIVFVIFQPIGTNSVLLIFNGPKISPC